MLNIANRQQTANASNRWRHVLVAGAKWFMEIVLLTSAVILLGLVQLAVHLIHKLNLPRQRPQVLIEKITTKLKNVLHVAFNKN